jgi:hypothetical protein
MASLPPKPDAVSKTCFYGCNQADLVAHKLISIFPFLSFPISQAESARLSQASNAGKAASTVNKYAKRDPALYPLIIIVGGIFATAGYMLSTSSSACRTTINDNDTDSPTSCARWIASKSGNDPARAFQRDVVNPWDESAKHDVHPS